MARAPRKSLSVSGPFFDKLERWCRDHDVPISAVVEIVIARSIGMPLDHLPETVRRWATQLPE